MPKPKTYYTYGDTIFTGVTLSQQNPANPRSSYDYNVKRIKYDITPDIPAISITQSRIFAEQLSRNI